MSDRFDWSRALSRLGDLLLVALAWACMALGGASAVPTEVWTWVWRMTP
jgi:hypothetical protein